MASTETILRETLALYKKMGIRAVTMDMVAEKLGMSKRTLYEQFPNKNDLINACLQLDMNEMKENAIKELGNSKNILEKIVSFMFFHINIIKQYSPNFLYDLNKYYLELSCEKTADFYLTMTNKIVGLIETGKKEQLFRNDINSEIAAKLVLEQFKYIHNETLFPAEKYSHTKIFEHIAITFIRGIATLKGYELIEEYYTKYKNSEQFNDN